jgi:uncharacterized protein YkwD
MAKTTRHHVAGGLAALVAAAACAAAGAAAAAEPAGGAARGGTFAPAKAASAQYGPDASRKCAMTATLRYVLDDLAEAAGRAGRPAPQADGRLCAVAEAFLAWDPGAGIPRPQVLAFVSQWFGLPGVVATPIVAQFEEKDQRLVAERIAQSSAGSAALNAVHPRMGMATQQVRRGREVATKVAIVVLDAPLEVEPFPRRLELGQAATLSGRLLGGAKNPIVYVSDVAGRLAAPEQAPGETFRAELRCGDRPGRIQVEIRGEREGGSGIAGGFPVACGQDAPASVAIAGEPWPSDADAAERKILDLVNAERTAAGASPLAWDAGVAGVARAISADLAERGGATGGPDVGERLKREGIGSPLVLQSAGADRTIERAQDRILASPRDRAIILDPEATHAGIGVVSRTDAEGRPIVYVTEVLIKELPPVDLEKVQRELRDAVAQKRKDARTNALSPDATLDEVAKRYAEALAAAGGALPKEKGSELTAPLNKGFRTVTMVSGAKQEPLDFAEEPQTTAPGKGLGVGVAQGRHPVLGRNAVYVVLMVGAPRASPEPPAKPPAPKKAPAAPKK